MNLYAVNATPLNGNETLFASAAAVIAVSADGQIGAVQKSQAAAVLHVAAAGQPILAQRGQADALITIEAQGWPSATYHVSGEADITLSASAKATLALLGQGDAAVTFGGRYDIPERLPVPSTYSDATRRIEAGADTRLIRVLADLPLCVREQRSLTIQPEGRA